MGTEFHCLHCGATVSTREIQDGWCDSCGKKVPGLDSVRDTEEESRAARTMTTSRSQGADGVCS